MIKAILIGNGFSSKLINNYNNNIMLLSFENSEPLLYEEIKKRYIQLHELRLICKTEEIFKERLFEIISKDEIPYSLETKYNEIVINSGLYNELKEPNICGIETVMKVAKLFKSENIEEIEQAARDICYNDGLNGINGINKADAFHSIDVEKAKLFINSFDYIFTTNYDYILDDLYDGDVQHIHGGFDYYRVNFKSNSGKEVNKYKARDNEFDIEKKYANNTEIVNIDSPFLIWGCNGIEKQSKTGGGFTLPMSIPFVLHSSCLKKHIEKLKINDINELHIFGYSGQNDSHINSAIKSNLEISKIVYYCNPASEMHDDSFKMKIFDIFASRESKLALKSWNEIWKHLQ